MICLAGAVVGIWTDAQRRDVFTALYQIGSDPAFTPARLRQIDRPAVGDPAATLLRWPRLVDSQPIVFAGDGSRQYGDLIRAQRPDARIIDAPPLAGVIGLMAAVMAETGDTIEPAEIRPLYIRRPDAEVDREKRALTGKTRGTPRKNSGRVFAFVSLVSFVVMDMTTVFIDPLSSDADLDAVLAIEAESFTSPWTREMYVAELANVGVSFCYLARDESRQTVGFCSFWRVLDELHVNNLAVAQAYRRRGIGTALMTFVLNEGTRLGAHRATLEVRRSNEAARQLYERLGFLAAGVRRAYYTNPIEDALVLWRERLPE